METKENIGDSTNSSEEDTTSSEMSVKELPPQTTFKTLLPVILMLVFIVVTWASPNVVGRYLSQQVNPLSPTQISALRYLPAAITLLLVCFASRRTKSLFETLKKKYLHLIIASIILASFVLLQMYSVKYTTASVSAFLLNVNPVITFVLSMIILKEKHRWWGSVGVFIAVIGVFFIAVPLADISQIFASEYILGNLLAFLSGAAWAIYSIYLKRFLKEEDFIVTSTWNLTFSAIILTVVMFIVDGWFTFTPSTTDILLTTFLGIVPTAISFTLWFETIKRIPVQKASVFQFLIPIIATILAIIFLGETINWQFGVGAGLILSGLVVTQLS
ncbi:MAG: DMT family transporter [Candidatus Heimdallarchaeota archaeon]